MLVKGRSTICCSMLRSIGKRRLATRSINDSPFDHLPKRSKPWLPWKSISFFLVTGAFLAYDDSLLKWYERYTSIDDNEAHLVRLRLLYDLKHLPIYEKLAYSKDDAWIKLESWENLDRNILDKSVEPLRKINEDEYAKHSLSSTTLSEPGGIFIKPVIFYNSVTQETVTLVHVGYRLCGYPFMVHGGILATLLNECLKRNASLSNDTSSKLKDDFKVENLSINYSSPVFANQYLIIKVKPSVSNEKKDISLEAVIESQDGKPVVRSNAILLDTGRASKNLMGHPMKWLSN